MANDSYFRIVDKMTKYTYSYNYRKMGKLKTQIPIYCIQYNWENWFNLKRTLDKIYMLNVFYVECLQVSLNTG